MAIDGGFGEEHFRHWLEHGYAVWRLLDDDELAAARADIDEYLPSFEEFARRPRWHRETIGRHGWVRSTFPFAGAGLNATTVHPDLVAFAERALRTPRIMLSHGRLGGKYAGTRDLEQELHVDYGNNMLVMPPPDSRCFDLPALVYYTDVTLDLGPTYVVSQQHTRDDPLLPRNRPRRQHPELYEREVAVTVPAGSVLVYSMRTFHRGSRLLSREGVRFSQNIAFKRCDATFCGQMTFQSEGGSAEMDAFLVTATPRQRELVGFPPVGSDYWRDETLEAVGRRYPRMDLSPYRTS